MRIEACLSSLCRLAVAALVLGFPCSDVRAERAPLPPLPTLSESFLATLQPRVGEQIQRALEAARAKPQDAETVGRLGMILHAYEKLALAGACYERAERLGRGDFQWRYYLGLVKQELGEDEEAVAYFSRAIEQQATFIPARLWLAKSLGALGKLHESRQVYEQIIKEAPHLALAHYGLGEVLSAAGDTPLALESRRRAVELAPEFGAAHYALALQYRDLGKTAESQQHFSLYQANRENSPPLEDPLVDAIHALAVGAIVHFERGRRLEQDGELEEAALAYEQTLDVDPRFGQAHVNLIAVNTLLGRVDQAEAHYRKGLEVNPSLAELHYNYGLLLARRTLYSDAEQAFRKALELNPYFADAHNNLGTILEHDGKTTEAEEHFRLAVENNPRHRLAHFNLGRALVRRKQYEEAIRYLRKTLTSHDDRTPTFMYVLADAYVRHGDLTKGLHYLQEGIRQARSFDQQELADAMEERLRQLKERGQ